ncbi:MAG: RHS repeat protein, partial [bacterium]|nr:RHS repeat protein [bacterium]
VWEYKLNDAGQCTDIRTPVAAWSMGYNEEGLLTDRTEPLGRETTLTYASDPPSRRSEGNLSEVRVTPGSEGANGSSQELVTEFEYESETNQPTRIVDPLDAVTIIERDGVGLAERITRAAGSEEAVATAYSYNAYGQPIEVVDPNLHRTTYEYFADDETEGSSGCTTAGSAGYLRGTLVDPDVLAIRTCYEADARGNVTAVVD